MVTVPQFGQQLQQRRTQLEATKQQIQSFQQPLTQRQLRTTTPMQRQKITSKVEQAKQQALKGVEKEFKTQQRLEGEFVPIQEKFTAVQRQRDDIAQARRILTGEEDREGASSGALRIVKTYEGTVMLPTATEQALGMSLPADIRGLTPGEVTRGVNLPAMTFAPELPTLPDIPSGTVELPSIGQRFRGKIKDITGISLPGTAQLKETFPRSEFTLGSVSGRIQAGTELIGGQVERGTIKSLEGRGFTQREVTIPSVVLPSTLPPVLFSVGGRVQRDQITTPEFTFGVGPEQAGKVARFGTDIALISAAPVLTLGSSAVQSVGIARERVPSVNQVIKEQTQDLTPEQRKQYLKTEEGKEYKLGVEQYVDSLEERKRQAKIQAGLSIGFLGVPAAATGIKRGTRFLREPIIVSRAPVPSVIREFGAVVAPRGEGAIATGVSGELFPGQIQRVTSRFDKFLGRPARAEFFRKPTLDLTVVPLATIRGGKSTAFGITQRVGPRTTLKKLDVSFGSQVLAQQEIAKMTPFMRFLAGKLPPRQVPAGTQLTVDVGKTFRLGRLSKGQIQLDVPRQLPPGTEIGVTRAIPLGTRGPVSVFGVESAIKSTKATVPRRAGRVDVVTGQVLVLPGRTPRGTTGTVIPGKLATQLTQKQEKQLAIQTAQAIARASRIPKRKPAITGTIETVQGPEAFTFFPRAVGGLGRGTSQFAGTGQYEVTDVVATRLPPVMAPSGVQTTFLTTKPEQTFSFAQPSGVGLRPAVALAQAPRQEQTFIPVFAQSPRVRQPTALSPRQDSPLRIGTRTTTRQVQRPVTQFGRPGRPRQPPRPIKRAPPLTVVPKLQSKIPSIRERKRKPGEELVIPFIRRFGRFIPVTEKPLPRARAIKVGVRRVERTLAASLQLRRPSGEILPFIRTDRRFRPGREQTIVQRAPGRLGRRSEVLEIVASRRAGNVKFF